MAEVISASGHHVWLISDFFAEKQIMHPSGLRNAKEFFDCYAPALNGKKIKAIEIGSQDVNGSLRSVCPVDFEYVGVDFVPGKGVDLILEDPYSLPFKSESADIILSSSCFEHSEMFWVLFLEIMRVLKKDGLFYLNVPSNGEFHRWPVDCWRFYPDSGNALVAWAERNKMKPALLESYTSKQVDDQWNDFVAVFLKASEFAHQFPNRIVHTKQDFSNGVIFNCGEFLNFNPFPEDKEKLRAANQ